MSLKILQNSHRNTCVGVSFFDKAASLRSQHRRDFFLLILRNFLEHDFYGLPLVNASIEYQIHTNLS